MKPAIDPATGCAHIKNLHTSLGYFRVCSACETCVPAIDQHHWSIEEEQITYCYGCGATFDHADDDPMEVNQ